MKKKIRKIKNVFSARLLKGKLNFDFIGLQEMNHLRVFDGFSIVE